MTPSELAAVEHRLAQFLPALEGLVVRLTSASRLEGSSLASTEQLAAASTHAGILEFVESWERLGFEGAWTREPALNSRASGLGLLIAAFDPIARRAGYLPHVDRAGENYRIRFVPNREAMEEVLGPNRRGEGTITPVVIEDAELRALEESLRLIRIRPPRQMTSGGNTLHFEFDEAALVKLIGRVEDTIAGLEEAMRRAAKHGWGFDGGNAVEMPKLFGPYLDLAEVTGIYQRLDLLHLPRYGITFGLKSERFREERGLSPEKLQAVFFDLTSWIMHLMRDIQDDQAEHEFPRITEDRLGKLRATHEDLAALLETRSIACERPEKGVERGERNLDQTASNVAIHKPGIAELAEKIRFELNAPMQAALLEFFVDRRVSSVEAVKRKVQGDKDKTDGSVRRLVSATNNSLASLASTLRFATKAGYVIKEERKE